MVNEQAKIKELKAKGYQKVYAWDAEPNEEDPDHTHPFDTHLVVISGEILIKMDKYNKTLRSGDEVEIPKETVHYGLVGAKGCKYIVAERH